MTIIESFEILSQDDGEFVGCFEIIKGRHFGELWDVDGDFSTYVSIDGLTDDQLYRTVIDEFCANKGCAHEDVYLTDDRQNEILLAL